MSANFFYVPTRLDVSFDFEVENEADVKSDLKLLADSFEAMPIFTHILVDQYLNMHKEYIIKKMQSIINQGGVKTGKYVWGVWKKVNNGRGKNNYELEYPSTRITKFSYATYLPILPSSYKRLRKVRKTLKPRQFALSDTRTGFHSYSYNTQYYANSNYYMKIYNLKDYMNKHELGDGVPRRPVFTPAYEHWIGRKGTQNMPLRIVQDLYGEIGYMILQRQRNINITGNKARLYKVRRNLV